MALNGLDISNWQAGTDFSSIDFDFVIIKATQGTGYVDKSCDGFFQQALAMGKCLGFYHYAGGSDPGTEAEYFVNNTSNYFHHAIPFLDWESADNARWGNNDNQWVTDFCNRVEELTDVRPLVYVQQSARGNIAGEIGNHGWIAQYPNNDRVDSYVDTPWNDGAYDCLIRQYTSNGYLNGQGRFDLDKFYGSVDDWNSYAKIDGSNPTPAPQPVPAPQPATPVSNGFAVGDTVVPTSNVDYNGTPVTAYNDNYTIAEINGDRAVLAVGGTVWAAMNTANIQKVGGSAPAASPSRTVIYAGDTVRPTRMTDYNGTAVASYHDSYVVSELSGDRAVLTYNGVVWAAMHVSDLERV
jgi:GH25 family lysozyme M1 (1,4-beta-N-acetylmuramidase)